MNQDTIQPNHDVLRTELTSFGRFRKRWGCLEGLGRSILIGPGALLVWFMLDWGIGLPAWPLFLSFLIVLLVGLYALVRHLLWPHLKRVVPETEALVVESLHGELDNQLIGSLQLGEEVIDAEESGRTFGYSRDYVAALLAFAARNLRSISAPSLIDLSRAKKALVGAGLVVLAVLLCLVLASGAVSGRVQRLKDAFAVVMDTLFPVELRVVDGNKRVVRGRPVRLEVEIKGARRSEILLTRTDRETEQTQVTTLPIAAGGASFVVEQAMESFSYYFEYSGRHTDTYDVLVADLPQLQAINFELAYPPYTGQPPRTITGRIPKLYGLAGTSVLVSFAATTKLSEEYCYVEWTGEPRQPISVTGRFGHFSFRIDKPKRASIHLTGEFGPGFEMEKPVSFEVVVQKDARPSIRILGHKRTATMLAEAAAELVVPWLAEDDFGITEVKLDYKIGAIDTILGGSPREGSLTQRTDPPQDRIKGKFAGALKSLSPPLQPGDKITISVSAKDNNTETGPSLGRSTPIEIVVVRPDLAAFVDQEFGFGHTAALLGGLRKIKRATDLLVEPSKVVRTEPKQDVAKKKLKARVSQETWPSGSEDSIGVYFRLLSGER